MANPLQQVLQRDYMDNLFSEGGKLEPLKPALSHLGLYLGLVAFTAMGAKVSKKLILFSAMIFERVTQPFLAIPESAYLIKSVSLLRQKRGLNLLN